MAIKKRDFTATGRVLQEPAIQPRVKPAYEASPGAVINTDLADVEKRVIGHLVYAGADPMAVPTDDLVTMLRVVHNHDNLDHSYRNRIRSKATSVRSYCVMCAQSAKGARMCASVTCPLWPFRMGNNPLKRKK